MIRYLDTFMPAPKPSLDLAGMHDSHLANKIAKMSRERGSDQSLLASLKAEQARRAK